MKEPEAGEKEFEICHDCREGNMCKGFYVCASVRSLLAQERHRTIREVKEIAVGILRRQKFKWECCYLRNHELVVKEGLKEAKDALSKLEKLK